MVVWQAGQVAQRELDGLLFPVVVLRLSDDLITYDVIYTDDDHVETHVPSGELEFLSVPQDKPIDTTRLLASGLRKLEYLENDKEVVTEEGKEAFRDCVIISPGATPAGSPVTSPTSKVDSSKCDQKADSARNSPNINSRDQDKSTCSSTSQKNSSGTGKTYKSPTESSTRKSAQYGDGTSKADHIASEAVREWNAKHQQYSEKTTTPPHPVTGSPGPILGDLEDLANRHISEEDAINAMKLKAIAGNSVDLGKRPKSAGGVFPVNPALRSDGLAAVNAAGGSPVNAALRSDHGMLKIQDPLSKSGPSSPASADLFPAEQRTPPDRSPFSGHNGRHHVGERRFSEQRSPKNRIDNELSRSHRSSLPEDTLSRAPSNLSPSNLAQIDMRTGASRILPPIEGGIPPDTVRSWEIRSVSSVTSNPFSNPSRGGGVRGVRALKNVKSEETSEIDPDEAVWY